MSASEKKETKSAIIDKVDLGSRNRSVRNILEMEEFFSEQLPSLILKKDIYIYI